jgi:hypothetical protein
MNERVLRELIRALQIERVKPPACHIEKPTAYLRDPPPLSTFSLSLSLSTRSPSITDFFRPHITFNHSITPIALDQLQLAILCLGDDATDPSAVGTSTEPDVRICLVIFLRQVATYSDSGTIRRTIGDILLVPEFSLDLLHVADEDDDEGTEHEPSGQGSQ